MWIAVNHTPFAIERSFVRDRTGAEVWLVAVRATFRVRPDGSLQRADQQIPVARVASYLGEPGKSSLAHEADLVLTKTGVDLLLHGHAHAPRGRTAEVVDVSIRCGRWVKVLRVHGDRVWMRGIGASALSLARARPFDKMPITYERAWGGRDPDAKPDEPYRMAAENPIGRGYTSRPTSLVDSLAPNIEDPRSPIVPGPGPQTPAGFGPLAPNWTPRRTYAGTYDEAWRKNRAPLWPADFDDRFFSAAPVDQQLPRFASDGQVLELVNLTPNGQMRIVLPRIRISVETIFGDGQAPKQEAALHTVLLEPDQARVQMVWHAAVPCHGREHLLERSLVGWEGDLSCLAP